MAVLLLQTHVRQDGMCFPGTTPVTYNGADFSCVSPNSASFVSDSISAYVVMDHGAFAYAILSSCGNPVVGGWHNAVRSR